MKFLSIKILRIESRLSFFTFISILIMLVLSFQQQAYSQQRAKGKETVRQAPASPQLAKNVRRAPGQLQRLFDARFEKQILNLSFIDRMTDEIEFMRIYRAMADDIGKLRDALALAMKSADKNYSACLAVLNTSHRRETAVAIDRIKKNRAPERAESLKSLLALIREEHRNYYAAEETKVKNTFRSLFDSFDAAFKIQKKVLISNTAYDGPTSEVMLALGTFEAGIKEKSDRIEKYISDKFDALGKGADYGDK